MNFTTIKQAIKDIYSIFVNRLDIETKFAGQLVNDMNQVRTNL